MDFAAAKEYILTKLARELPADLTYHSLNHTLDVHTSVEEIGQRERVGTTDLLLLKTAALYHDAGFTRTYSEHEAAGCEIAREILPGFGYTSGSIEVICGMIMATKIPQSPQTHLEEILCDADLYYLGRDDFFPVGNSLYREFLSYGVVQNETEWNKLQIGFLESHQYFTSTAKAMRASRKASHLAQVRELV